MSNYTNMSDPNLVTTCNFNNRDYFIKMHVTNSVLELVITDKQTGEDWQCCYDAAYIENITQKTGNFKQFHIFTAMLKSGLLKTSNSVYLDLMTFDDLDNLRNHRIRGPYSVYHASQSNNNRRYLILTYTVEFDRIHYPLPLEYCGPPDPKILQQNILQLEQEIVTLKDHIKCGASNKHDSRAIVMLQKKVDDLTEDNLQLRNEAIRLSNILEKKSKNQSNSIMFQNAIKKLEQRIFSERKSHHKLVEKLRRDKVCLSKELDRVKHSEKTLINMLHIKDTKKPKSMKRGSDPGPKGDSRSPSPRLTKSESYETNIPVKTTKPKRLSRSPRPKRRHKSSSGSESDRDALKSVMLTNMPSITKTMNSRPCSASSRSSNESMTLTTTPNTYRSRQKSENITPRKASLKNSEFDFTTVENGISAIQKMIHMGLHIT